MTRGNPAIIFEQMKDQPVGRRSPADVWFFDEEGVLCEVVGGQLGPSETVRHVAYVKPDEIEKKYDG